MEFVRRNDRRFTRLKVLFCETDRSWVRMSDPGLPVLPEASAPPIIMFMERPEPFVVVARERPKAGSCRPEMLDGINPAAERRHSIETGR
jgi:hypothetical protein